MMYRVRPFTVQIVHSFCRQAVCRIRITAVKHGVIRTRVVFSLCIYYSEQGSYDLWKMKIIGPIQDHYSTNGKHLAFMT